MLIGCLVEGIPLWDPPSLIHLLFLLLRLVRFVFLEPYLSSWIDHIESFFFLGVASKAQSF